MGTGEESRAKPSKPSSSTQEIPVATSYPDWSSSMQAYYTPGATPFFASTVASPTPHPYLWGSQHPLIPSYGTPIPYQAMYPPGSVYAHPSMAMTPNATQHSTEFVSKGPNGKDKASAKSLKGTSAKISSIAGENGKAGSGSGNDGISESGESGSEGSSDANASDENTNQQESATNKKRSFDQIIRDNVSANAQNNSVGAISQSSVPGKSVVSNLDWWNASPASAEAPKMRHNQSSTIMGRDVALNEHLDERELKRQKRKQSNRESARRSRLRRQAGYEELQKRVESLGNENRLLREELERVSEECKKLASENNSIKEELARLCGPDAVANLE